MCKSEQERQDKNNIFLMLVLFIAVTFGGLFIADSQRTQIKELEQINKQQQIDLNNKLDQLTKEIKEIRDARMR